MYQRLGLCEKLVWTGTVMLHTICQWWFVAMLQILLWCASGFVNYSRCPILDRMFGLLLETATWCWGFTLELLLCNACFFVVTLQGGKATNWFWAQMVPSNPWLPVFPGKTLVGSIGSALAWKTESHGFNASWAQNQFVAFHCVDALTGTHVVPKVYRP